MAMKRALFVSAAAMVMVCLTGVWAVRAQSLADLAKKEEERRKATPQPAKVYTNKDLAKAPPASPSASGEKPADASKDADAEGKDAKDAKGKGGDDKAQVKDQAYWSKRQKDLQTKLEQDQGYASAMQSQINALTTEFTNMDDPVKRSQVEQARQKALSELNRLTKAIVDDQKALAAFQEEARAAGVPPGWLR
jgi:hypothetical protein